MLDRRGVAQRDVVEKQREDRKEHQQRKAAQRPMAPVERQRSGTRRGTGDEDYVQMVLLRFPARAPRGNWQYFGKISMRRLHQIIHGESAMAELLQRRSRELALEQHVKNALPRSLANCVRWPTVVRPSSTLSATSGAAAALLRQRAPELAACTRRRRLRIYWNTGARASPSAALWCAQIPRKNNWIRLLPRGFWRPRRRSVTRPSPPRCDGWRGVPHRRFTGR